jgi:superfamily II DNA/RNA helicase
MVTTKVFSMFVRNIHLENRNFSAFLLSGNTTYNSKNKNLKQMNENKSFPEGNMM